jgi:hypothetical protein
VLVTNYSMLEYMLMRPFERPIFAETKRWLAQDGAQLLLVLDEAHMYRGAKGAEVAFLIRRLRARLGIHDRPDKLRVIATSASLGERAAEAQQPSALRRRHHRQAPRDFEAITGTREVPEPASPATEGGRDTARQLDLDAHQRGPRRPDAAQKLAPLLPASPGDVSPDEASVLAELHAALVGKPWVNQLVKEAAGARGPRRARRARVPRAPTARRALEALLTVGTLARQRPTSRASCRRASTASSAACTGSTPA